MSYKKDQPNDETHSQCVIPKPRGNWAQLMKYILLALCVFILYLSEQSLDHTLQRLIIHFTALQVGALLKGICIFVEEVHHLTSRYYGSYLKALSASLDLRRQALFLLLCGAAYRLLLKEVGLPLYSELSLLCLCQLLSIIFGLQHPSAAEISEIYEQNNCNVAQGLAWSYYVGYLKFILPRFKDSICEFNKEHNILRNCDKTWKLHILIPLSCDVYADLQKVDSHLQFISNLPELQMDQAGIKKRSYKNSVYGICGEDQMMNYCVLEYATPLLSLYAMSQDETAAFSRQDRTEQAKLFCRTLEEILQRSKDCSGCYRLIIYDDSEESDKHFLSKLILQHIRQQQHQEYAVYEREQNCIQTQNILPDENELLISGSDQPLPLQSGAY
uniref:Stimulator of interferon genes protein n=1 Tax=Pogona vitticeps TaxID=103695 RepID=A0A6J0TCP5_9SAUR